jgi:alpha-ribazole phosphatase
MFFGDWEMRHHRDLQQEDENYAAWCADWQHAAPTNGESFQHLPNASAVYRQALSFGNLTIC